MLKFDRQGLIPTVIQDEATDEVLMVAFMNEEALNLTREFGLYPFFQSFAKCDLAQGGTIG